MTEADEDEEWTKEDSPVKPTDSEISLDGGSRIHVGNRAITKLGLAKLRQDRLQDVESSDKRTLNLKEPSGLKLKPCQLYGKLLRSKSTGRGDLVLLIVSTRQKTVLTYLFYKPVYFITQINRNKC